MTYLLPLRRRMTLAHARGAFPARGPVLSLCRAPRLPVPCARQPALLTSGLRPADRLAHRSQPRHSLLPQRHAGRWPACCRATWGAGPRARMPRMQARQHGTPHGRRARARSKSFSMRRDFSALVRMMPVDVMVPTTGGLTLALPASGPRLPTSYVSLFSASEQAASRYRQCARLDQ